MAKLVNSRRFWVAIIDLAAAVIAFVVAHYVPNPDTAELVKFLWASFQPVAFTVIVAYTADDVFAIKAGTHPDFPPQE